MNMNDEFCWFRILHRKSFDSEIQLTQHCNSKVHRKKVVEEQRKSSKQGKTVKAKEEITLEDTLASTSIVDDED